MLFNPAIERHPALQNARLREQVAGLQGRGPFYQRRLAGAGGRPAACRGLEDLPKPGFTKKAGFRDSCPFGLFAGPAAEGARRPRASGATGKAPVAGCPASGLGIFGEVGAA